MRNNTLMAVLDLEAELKKLTTKSTVNAIIKTDSIEQLNNAAKQLGCHVFTPFEINDLNVHFFKYSIPKSDSTITVRHTEEYRFKKTLVPVS